jgi:hypothetical protein
MLSQMRRSLKCERMKFPSRTFTLQTDRSEKDEGIKIEKV